MTVTTAADLLVRAHALALALALRDSHHRLTLQEWERFEVTLHRALNETVGPEAGYVHCRDPHRSALLCAIRAYPTPLRPPADIPLTPAQAGRLLNIAVRGVHRRIRAGHLRAVHDGNAVLLHARDLDQRPDITPADPTDPQPLARLTVTMGALGDLLHHARTTGQPVLDAPGEAAATMRHLLAIGRLAAGRTLTAMPLADAGRAFAVAQYTERVLDTLADATAVPASLGRLRAVVRHRAPLALGDRLEAALDAWTSAARADLTRAIPAADGLRFLATQAVHLYAITHQVMAADQPDILDPDGATTAALTAAARAARATNPLWANLTTLARPTLEYASTSRALLPVLDDVVAALRPATPQDLDTQRALADLSQAATTIADLMAATRSLPERLARSQLLHTPKGKGRKTLADLHNRRPLLTRAATPGDITDLAKAWAYAGHTARAAAIQLHHALSAHPDHPLHTLTPIQWTL